MIDEGTLAENYRPISTLAVVGAVLALLSLLAFAATPFLIVAVVAVVVNFQAVLRLTKAHGEMAGLNMARGALFISLCCLSVAGAQTYYRRHQRVTHVRFVSAKYLDLILSNRQADAFLYRLMPYTLEGKSREDILLEHGRDFNQEFLHDPLFLQFQGKAHQAQVTFRNVGRFDHLPGRFITKVSYWVDVEGQRWDVQIHVHGEYAPHGGIEWHVTATEVAPVPSSEGS